MARPKSEGEIKSHQQHLLISPSEVKAIDDWRFANHINSRAEAIRRLCQIGLTTESAATDLRDQVSRLADAIGVLHDMTETDEMELAQNGRDIEYHRQLAAMDKTDLLTEVLLALTEVEGEVRNLADSAMAFRTGHVDPKDAQVRHDHGLWRKETRAALAAHIRQKFAKKKGDAQ